jgi:hypothetical protein
MLPSDGGEAAIGAVERSGHKQPHAFARVDLKHGKKGVTYLSLSMGQPLR